MSESHVFIAGQQSAAAAAAGMWDNILCLTQIHTFLVTFFAGDVRVFEGHAFIVEAAVSIGGKELKPGINVYRFANRIPLLFEGGSDVITRTATKRINWNAYKINQSSDKVCVETCGCRFWCCSAGYLCACCALRV